ncbi:zf-HC2 domain-containing protein [Chitinophaga sp. S165]|uniref:zf-HC2 domain-containing protein n=1 Tax=Chitinophaga sp. S165 TaxID=2135462 RepID=UPI000D70AC31|nr:zf-HC2 domain-containing protein [Chitinophaga sp. S165]PWV54444.1 tetratricopeptide repeat protein [Chitinophaga sp. S165]
MQNLDNKDKILKIFSRVHCFNKDQLPRYVDGRLTHVEKHLLEQHLVNCELCSDAVEILQKPKFKAQYQSMGVRVQQYVRNSSHVAPVYEAERYQKNVQIKESFLTYFWGTVAAALVIGFFYQIQREEKKEEMKNPWPETESVATAVARPEPNGSFGATTSASIATFASATTTLPLKEEGTEMSGKSKVEPESKVIADETSDPDKFLYKTAMTFYHQGNLDEAMPRFTQLTTDTASSYRELAHYQLAMCFKFKKQKGKARQMFKELVNMNGRMKRRAQLALNRL